MDSYELIERRNWEFILLKVLNVPDDYEVPVIIPVGYPGDDSVRCKQYEISINNKMHINNWYSNRTFV